MKRPAEDGDIQVMMPMGLGQQTINGCLPNTPEKVAILDCGAQYGKVIDRRVRELNVESDILPLTTSASELLEANYKAVIISGGPKSVYAADAPPFDSQVLTCGLPVLGICYGFQLINKEFGGHVEQKLCREDGQYDIHLDTSCKLFKGLSDTETVLLTHGDTVTHVSTGYKVIARSGDIVAGIANESCNIYGVQFHPEVDLTPKGTEMLRNFLYTIAGCHGVFSMKSREESIIHHIRSTVGEKKVLVLVSGGVDSTVCAALLSKALNPNQVVAVHIDNGFMRKNESELVKQSLRNLGYHLRVHSQALMFYNACGKRKNPETGEEVSTEPLCQVIETELKRRIIGDTFMRAFEEALQKLNLRPEDVILAQGTLRPDLIESASALASGGADVIKTHHNDTQLVRDLRAQGKVIEPLKDFHKDEVRRIGTDLGLPDSIVQRHPFPGPGLAIRIICSIEPYIGKDFNETQAVLRVLARLHDPLISKEKSTASEHEKIVRTLGAEELEKIRQITSQVELHTTLLPIKTVGVQGDARSYSYCVALSTSCRPVPWPKLFAVARIIPRLCHNINSPITEPVYDITPTRLTQNVISLLQEVDDRATKVLFASGYMDKLSQMPVILVPIHFDRPVSTSMAPSVLWSVCIRTFITNDFMTGVPAVPNKDIPEQVVESIVKGIQEGPLISRVMYDMTPKPPGTTEWE